MRTRSNLFAAAVLWFCGAAASAQEATEVDVELVLAVDVSWSMTADEIEIQRRGYAEALVSDPVLSAIGGGYLGRIALTYVEWAGSNSQRVVVDWTLVRDRADAADFAARLTAASEPALRRTSISGALDFAVASLAGNRFDGLRRVIDVSGDGPNNQGRPVEAARDDAVARGIVVNGLPLMTREGMGARWHLDDLDEYYRRCVIGGPGAFVIPVLDWEEFAQAVRQKLVLDLVERGPAPDGAARVMPAASHGYDCLVGEAIWNRNYGGWN